MRQFFAVLKDSFREAVDGFVIYVMLGLAAIIILVVASMSFTPVGPGEAFDAIGKRFAMTFPDKGRSRVISASRDNTYKATDVQPEGDGYRLRLTVTGRSQSTTDGKHEAEKGDSFRRTVAAWSKMPGRTMKASDFAGEQGKGGQKGPDIEFTFNQEATAEEPTYAFDVTTSGGSSVRGWPHAMRLFFGTVTVSENASLGQVLWIIEDQIINGLGGALALLIGLIITAFFIPNMLRKGSIDLLLSKPMGRSELLIYKYVGGLTFVFLVTAFTVGGIWLAIALRSGYWDPSFLAVIPLLTFTFAIVYAVSTAVAVFTRSPIAAMIVSIGFMLFLYIVGQVKSVFDSIRVEDRGGNIPEWAFTLVSTLNNVLPRYKDLDKLTSKLIADGTLTEGERRMVGLASIEYPSWGATFGVSLVFIVLMLALSCLRMSRRDY